MEDVCVIERITSLTSSITMRVSPVPETAPNNHQEKGSDSPITTQSSTQVGEDEACTAFNQATDLLERYLTKPEIIPRARACSLMSLISTFFFSADLSVKVHEAVVVLRGRPHVLFSERPTDEKRKKIDRIGKAFEKLRRAAVKVTDISRLQGSEAYEASRLFLVSAVDTLENVPTIVSSSCSLSAEPDIQFCLHRTENGFGLTEPGIGYVVLAGTHDYHGPRSVDV